MKNLLQEFIQLSLQESTRADREGVNLPSEYDQIEKYVNKGYFVQLTELNKLGVNPHSEYNETPLGIYTYPLTQEIFEQLIDNSLPTFNECKYINIIKPKNPEKVLTLQNMTEKDCLKYLNQFLKIIGYKKQYKTFEQLKIARRGNNPGALFYGKMKAINDKNENNFFHNWSHTLRKMGIDGIIDLGDKIIYPNEPTQAVFFSRNAVELLETFSNPQFRDKRKEKIINFRKELKLLDRQTLKLIYDIIKQHLPFEEELEKIGMIGYKIRPEIFYGASNAVSFDDFVKFILNDQKNIKNVLKQPII